MNEYPGLVDSHLHLLSLYEKGLDPTACLTEFFDAGGRWALDVAVDSQNWDQRRAWIGAETRVGLTTGIHPSEALTSPLDELATVALQASEARCWALGEIGLDWYRGREAEQAQRELFRAQLVIAREHHLPIVVHNREADRELLEDLDASAWTGQGIQHCFSSDLGFARQALDRGFFLSFAGNVTYRSASVLREVAAWAPLDRILVETDAPYLAPVPHRGQPNRPAWAGITAQCLAEVRRVPLEAILEATCSNFERLVGLSTGRE